MMHGGWGFGGFWFFGFLPILFFVIARIFVKGGHSSYHRRHRHPRYFDDRESGEPELKKPKDSKDLPKEMLDAARDVLDKIDWEIRLLERQRLDLESAEERGRIELELKKKKNEYKAVVEKLDL